VPVEEPSKTSIPDPCIEARKLLLDHLRVMTVDGMSKPTIPQKCPLKICSASLAVTTPSIPVNAVRPLNFVPREQPCAIWQMNISSGYHMEGSTIALGDSGKATDTFLFVTRGFGPQCVNSGT
jgi:hypothetical protein